MLKKIIASISNSPRFVVQPTPAPSSPRKTYDETSYENGIFVRNYGKTIVGFGSRHMHLTNNPEHIASIKSAIDQELEKLNSDAMVFLEGGANLDTRQEIPIEFFEKIEKDKNSSEMAYAFLKVCELKKDGRIINAIFVEPTFSDQIDFLIDCKVPAELIFSYLIIRNIPVVLHDMAMDVNVSMEQKMADIQTVDDFIAASLKTIQAEGRELTPADSFQLSLLLKSIKNSKSTPAFSHFLEKNGHPKSDEELIHFAFENDELHTSLEQFKSIIKNSPKANEFTAPINANNLNVPKLMRLQNTLKSLPIGSDQLHRCLNQLEDQARPILDKMRSQFYDFNTAMPSLSSQYHATEFNVISSMLNLSREQGIKDKLREFLPRQQVMVMFGSGHIRSLHSYFLNLS
ncbi:MAG: hypothetical protein VXX85_05375 [Candidatus Margulisiibacteriota bacterium]|nr:hypothetical protein [Candidatus Margulisiibacteriota bacterium]